MKSIRVGEIAYHDDLVATFLVARQSEVTNSATCYSEEWDIIYIFQKDDGT